MTKLDTVPLDKKHKKLLKKLQDAEQKHKKHSARHLAARDKMDKFEAKLNNLQDKITAYEERYHDGNANSQPPTVSLKKAAKR